MAERCVGLTSLLAMMDRLVLLGRRFVMGRMTVLNMRMDPEGKTRY